MFLNISYPSRQFCGLGAVLPYLQEVQLLLEGQEAPADRVGGGGVQCCTKYERKNGMSDEAFNADLSAWVSLLSRRSWLSLRSLKVQHFPKSQNAFI